MKNLIRRSILIVVLSIGFYVIFFKPTDISKERIILEHTFRSYIAPECFEELELTNYLEESSLKVAKEKKYKPHSKCTEEILMKKSRTIYQKWKSN
ncbi:hypothetical protein [Psychrobacillus sp.]|uniref:hypothetical protein n=1 Tax=Psychrobacillus sp. TaxID=1871623 RepID=UPI0028BEFA3D|nr:hypothetical protein [Psychrobacillus sp.]